MLRRGEFMAGVLTGGTIVLVAWYIAVISIGPKAAEPAGRHSQLYDECLAGGRNTMACDALIRVVRRIAEKNGSKQPVTLPIVDEAFPQR